MVLAVINFWLFAQTLLNVIPGIQDGLGIERTMGNLAVSVTSLFSGISIVGAWAALRHQPHRYMLRGM